MTTEGQADLDTARTVRRIERFFHALKVGTRIRRLDEADDLRKCLAFDAITAFRVWDLSLLARERPDDPASRHVTEDDIRALCASHYASRCPGDRRMTIAGCRLTGGLAGFHPSKRQPLPGTQKLWEGVKFLSQAVITIQAMQEWNRKKTKGEVPDGDRLIAAGPDPILHSESCRSAVTDVLARHATGDTGQMRVRMAKGCAMGVSGAVVLYAVIWALTFYCVLPLGIRSQSESKRVVRGTPPSAPSEPGLRWKVLRTTVVGTLIWLAVACVIEFDLIPFDSLEAALFDSRE